MPARLQPLIQGNMVDICVKPGVAWQLYSQVTTRFALLVTDTFQVYLVVLDRPA